MLFQKKASSTDAKPESRHHKEVHAPDPLQLPGKLPMPAQASRINPQALRHTAQAFVFCGLAALFLVYIFQVWSRGTEAARRKVCRGHLHMLSLALQMYANDFDGSVPPPDGNLPRQILTYVDDPQWFLCPSDDASRPALRRIRSGEVMSLTSYTYHPPMSCRLDSEPDPAGFPFMWDTNGGVVTGAHRKGGNVLYLDGHIQWRPLRLWSAADWPW